MPSTLTSQQIRTVRDSFAKVAPRAEEAARIFYHRLFALDPGLTFLFPTDLTEQGRKLMAMLAAAVSGLDDFDTLVPVVQALGRRHATYAVEPEDYDTVGAALLWTLENCLEEAFTPAVRDAWAAVYGLLAAIMIGASLNEEGLSAPVSAASVV